MNHKDAKHFTWDQRLTLERMLKKGFTKAAIASRRAAELYGLEILQSRISYQVGDENNPGGAWYPESIAAWEKAQVVREGTYVALIASAEHQTEIVEQFQQQFQ